MGASVALLAESKDEIAEVAASGGSTPTTASTPIVSETTSENDEGGDAFGIMIDMPALSSTMKEGKIVAWSKNIGDKVEVGDVLMVVESDKADMDVEAFEEGL